MGKIIRFFNYDAALAYYENSIDHMRQAYTRHEGVRIIAKPILILSIIKGIKDGKFKANRFDYDELNALYEPLFRKYFMEGRQENLTPLCYPFFYLKTDQFWHLSWKPNGSTKTEAPSASWIRRNVDHAFIDDELWLLLNNDEYADKLKEYVVNAKIVQQLHSIELAAESQSQFGIKSFLTFLLAI